jgi:uncharacterized membrane protein YfcA
MPHFEIACVIVFLASIVRGYTGFGFAAIAISGLNLIWPAQMSVPVTLFIDVISAVRLLPSVRRHADMTMVKNLSMGAVAGIPIGLSMLLFIPDQPLKILISGLILLMAVGLFFSPSFKIKERAAYTRIVGGISGGFTAAASVGGLPLICYLMSTAQNALVQRATVVVFLACTDIVSIALLLLSDAVDLSIWKPVLLLLIPALAGVQCGHWCFTRRPPKTYRTIALPILTLLSVVTLFYTSQQLLTS